MSEPKARPILFSGEMIRALLDGRKTQTRRVVKQPERYSGIHNCGFCCPYGQPGDLLWVKEAWAKHACAAAMRHARGDGHPWGSPIYQATFTAALAPVCEGFTSWRSPRFMPRWASRLTLRITDVRVQRVQEISEADAEAEGADPILVPPDGGSCPHIEGFERLWDSINDKRGFGWVANPWVWAITFEAIQANVDDVLAGKSEG